MAIPVITTCRDLVSHLSDKPKQSFTTNKWRVNELVNDLVTAGFLEKNNDGTFHMISGNHGIHYINFLNNHLKVRNHLCICAAIIMAIALTIAAATWSENEAVAGVTFGVGALVGGVLLYGARRKQKEYNVILETIKQTNYADSEVGSIDSYAQVEE